MIWVWGVHAVAAALVVTPVVLLTRDRVHWHSWELLSLILPFCVWTAFMFSGFSMGSKSLSNFAVEPGILGLSLAMGALFRAAIGKSLSERTASVLTLIGMCVIAAGVFWLIPVLPE